MRRRAAWVALWCLVVSSVVLVDTVVAHSAPAGLQTVDRTARSASQTGTVLSDTPAPHTPHVLDGRVYSVVQLGRTIVLGGTFTQVRQDGRTERLRRRGLVAFDAITGRILRRFAPDPRGDVRVVLPAADGRSVYVGGEFTSIGGTRRARLARVRVSDGSVVRSFRPGLVTGAVKDLALVQGRLWVAGAFTHVDGHAQKALATVGALTGRWTDFMSLRVRGHHQRGATQVLKIAASRDASRIVAIGNVSSVDGVSQPQLSVLDLTGRHASVSRFRTSFYSSRCSQRFDTQMRDVDISPDGAYFAVGTTGSYGGPTGSCDTVARFELDSVGQNVAPSWVAYTGGDTTYSVEATPAAVYVGGHQRWWNNPFGNNRPGPGAVARSGIAALDPSNGLPLVWNPGRDRGVGVFDFLVTPAGLWVASDTTRIGGQDKGRIARFPATGPAKPAPPVPHLPADVLLGGYTGSGEAPPTDQSSGLRRRRFTGSSAGADTVISAGGLDWDTVRGAFMLGQILYVAHADGAFTARCFDGTDYGPATAVSSSDQLVVLRDWADDVRFATGMFFDRGRIYFTRQGSNLLYYRYFSPPSGVVGAQRMVASSSRPGLDLARVAGMFVVDDRLYWATPDGVLRSVSWRHRGLSAEPSGAPGPVWLGAADSRSWSSRALFLQGSGSTPCLS